MTDKMGDRFKAYENCYRIYLPKRQAVIVRVDGRAFHSFTKGFARPYDIELAAAMHKTALKLAENISGCKFNICSFKSSNLFFKSTLFFIEI